MQPHPAPRGKIPFYLMPFALLYIGFVAILAAILFPFYALIPPFRPVIRGLGTVFSPITRIFFKDVGPDPADVIRK